MPAILVFAGSIRTGSFNGKLAARAAVELAEAGAEVTHVSLADYPMPLYDGDMEAAEGVPDAAGALTYLMSQHQGVFIACPEYNGSITPLLKNTLDWVSRVKVPDQPPLVMFRKAVFALGSASPGALGGLRSLMHTRHTLTLGLGALVIPEQVAVGNAAHAFAEDGSLTDPRVAGMLKTACQKLVVAADALA
jgi:NAD(P)H-dependent FMN reductase